MPVGLMVMQVAWSNHPCHANTSDRSVPRWPCGAQPSVESHAMWAQIAGVLGLLVTLVHAVRLNGATVDQGPGTVGRHPCS